MRLEILTEEKSMDVFLRGLLPRILPDEFVLDLNCFIRSHDGKSDLIKSIPKIMKAYPHFPDEVRVLIIHDQDSNDCVRLKESLVDLCDKNIHHVVRIACKELGNWYLGDFKAIQCVFPEVKSEKYEHKSKYRIPDRLNGTQEMKQIAGNFAKVLSAREISRHIDIENNRSVSFQHFVKGLNKLIASL